MESTRKPLVSIRVLTYNHEDFISECLDSILEQTYKNIEIVISDDGSQDSTASLLKDYADRYPKKIRLFLSDVNNGVTANANIGLENCNGHYIAGLGGDDILLPEKISKQVAYMEQNQRCVICYHDIDVFESISNKTLYKYSQKKKPKNGNYKLLISNPGINGACSNMIRSNNFKEIGFDPFLPVASDVYCWFKILKNGGEIHYIDETLARYRMHENNVSTPKGNVTQNNLDHLVTFQKMIKDDPSNTALIFRAYLRYLLSLRKQTDYAFTCWINLIFNLSPKALVGLMAYCISFGKIKL